MRTPTHFFLSILFATACSPLVILAQDVPEPPQPELPNPVQQVGKDAPKADVAKKEAPKKEAEKQSEEDQAPDKILAGHSMHGEVFNEGARQKAYLMPGCGDIDFPVTTKNEVVQKFVNQGLGQMHGFWYFESERSFRQAAALDPDCAIAYWGMAYANLGNEKRAKGFMKEAMQRKDKASRREQLYIDALNTYLNTDSKKRKERGTVYVRALEKILYDFPDDVECRSLLALHMWKNRSQAKINHTAIDAVMGQVFAKSPMHPTHHYRIHLWDYERPQIAVSSASKSGQSAPGIAHMWHMGGHIFSRLKRYNDAAWQQEASARVDHAHMMRDRVLPDQIHNFAHNNEWLVRNLNNVGRVHDAINLSANMIELPRHPKYNTITKRGSTMYGRTRLFETLRRYEKWRLLVEYCESPYLEPTSKDTEIDKRLRYLATAHYRLGDLEKGDAGLAELRTRLEAETKKRDEAVEKAKAKKKEELEKKAKADTLVEKDKKAVEKDKQADDKAKQAVDKDKKAVDAAGKAAAKPFDRRVRELEQAVNALEGHRAWTEDDTTAAYEKLKKAGGEDSAHLALVQFLSGKRDEAIAESKKQVERRTNEVHPLASLIDLLWRAEKKDEAKKYFDKIRAVGGYADLKSSPVFERLAPIAGELGLPEDWRTPESLADDIGNRVPLASLGPFRWSPLDAPDWTLADALGNQRSMKEYQGKPVVAIFYLGVGCLHCVEQLHAFAPQYEKYKEAGIEIVGISSDGKGGLEQSINNFDKGKLPIPLVSDPQLEVFKRYRCFDDFEKTPLHGTFIISGDGKVLWQDISYEPFMDPNFVLTEAKRLLEQHKARSNHVAPADSLSAGKK